MWASRSFADARRTAEQAAVEASTHPALKFDPTKRLRAYHPEPWAQAPPTQGRPCVNPDVMEKHRGAPRCQISPARLCRSACVLRLRLRIVFHFLLHGDGVADRPEAQEPAGLITVSSKP